MRDAPAVPRLHETMLQRLDALRPLRFAADDRSRSRRRAGDRPCRLRRVLRRGRKARRRQPQGQAGDRRRFGAARGRRHLLLYRSHVRGPIGDADVARPRAMPQCRRVAARHGEICAGWPRNSRPNAGAHALGRAAVHRRGVSRSDRLRRIQRRKRRRDARALRPASRSRDRRDGFGRPQLLQVSGETRLGSRQAARFRIDHAGRSEGLARPAKRWTPVGRR